MAKENEKMIKEQAVVKSQELVRQITRATELLKKLEWNDERAKKIERTQNYVKIYIFQLLKIIHRYEDEDYAKGGHDD